jgi:hypothetical protein
LCKCFYNLIFCVSLNEFYLIKFSFGDVWLWSCWLVEFANFCHQFTLNNLFAFLKYSSISEFRLFLTFLIKIELVNLYILKDLNCIGASFITNKRCNYGFDSIKLQIKKNCFFKNPTRTYNFNFQNNFYFLLGFHILFLFHVSS